MKLALMSALFVLALGTGVAFAQQTPTTLRYPPFLPTTSTTTTTRPTTTTTAPTATTTAPTTATTLPETPSTLDANAANVAAGQTGLPRTGSSGSIPTAAIAGGMVIVGSLLVVAARRRNATRRS